MIMMIIRMIMMVFDRHPNYNAPSPDRRQEVIIGSRGNHPIDRMTSLTACSTAVAALRFHSIAAMVTMMWRAA